MLYKQSKKISNITCASVVWYNTGFRNPLLKVLPRRRKPPKRNLLRNPINQSSLAKTFLLCCRISTFVLLFRRVSPVIKSSKVLKHCDYKKPLQDSRVNSLAFLLSPYVLYGANSLHFFHDLHISFRSQHYVSLFLLRVT